MEILFQQQVLWLGIALILAGSLTGLLAGVFGVGGGTAIVPVLYEAFGIYGVSDDVRMPLCVGTSLAVIVPTSVASFKSHYQRGAVDLGTLTAWILPISVGVILGIVAASNARPVLFKVVFVLVCLFLAIRLLAGKDKWKLGSSLPGRIVMAAYGFMIGLSSALMGIGGGLVANIVFSLYGRPIHVAVATASGVGIIVSLPGAIGYGFAGWNHYGLPPLSAGYVSVLGLMLLTPLSVVTARYGARLAHYLSKRHLELAFSAYLGLVSARFAVSLL